MYGIEHIARSLCTAFLHSIWLGALLLMAGYLMSWLLAARSAASRYNILCFLMVLFLAGFLFTFIRGLEDYHALTTQAISSHPAITRQDGPGSTQSFISTAIKQIEIYSFELSAIWLIIFVIKLLGTIRSLSQLHAIKNRASSSVDSEWERKISELATHLEIKVKVTLKESYRVSQPMVVGILKPIILFPAGLINHLSLSEVEAILLHELAHIGRRDFLVNILQNFAESIFFFNPFVLRLSGLLRMEREFCCDELAIRRVDKKDYLQAILSFLQFQAGPPAGKYVIGLTGGSSLMIQRVNRIVGISKTDGQGKMLALLGCVLGMMMFFSLTSIITIDKTTSPGFGLRAHPSAGKENAGDLVVDLRVGVKTASQNNIEHTALPTTITRDTIPAGLPKNLLDNKDYMAGYRAGMNYQSGRAGTGQVNSDDPGIKENTLKLLLERKQIEKAISDTFINKTTPLNPALIQSRKELEAGLIRRKVI